MSRRNDRREFLKQMGLLLAAGGVSSWWPQFRLLGQALAQTSSSDYRALVCVYLAGGNDAFNWLVPREINAYNVYRTTRGGVYDPQSNPTGLAIARDALLPIAPINGGDYGLHPSCPELKQLFDQGKLAFIANIGALIVPTTKAQYLNRSVPLPRSSSRTIARRRSGRSGMETCAIPTVGAESSRRGSPPARWRVGFRPASRSRAARAT